MEKDDKRRSEQQRRGFRKRRRRKLPILSRSGDDKKITSNQTSDDISDSNDMQTKDEFEFLVEHTPRSGTSFHISLQGNKRKTEEISSQQKQDVTKSLPCLLYRRQIGAFRDPFRLCRRKKDSNSSKCRKWFKFSKRRIPFSALKTPLSDAVLGLDRSGSFLVSIGYGGHRCHEESFEDDHEDTNSFHLIPSLSLRFYGTCEIMLYEI